MTPLQVGITGGIGSGKSLVSRIFNTLGVPVYDADSRAKMVMTSDKILNSQIKKEFGENAYDAEGNLDRSYLSKQAFGAPDRLEKLNQLVHPRVALDYAAWWRDQAAAPYTLKEAALLFEADSAKSLDKIIVVSAPLELRIQRVLKRDAHRSEEDVRKIISNQLPEEEKVKRADVVIINDEIQPLLQQVLELHRKFTLLQS